MAPASTYRLDWRWRGPGATCTHHPIPVCLNTSLTSTPHFFTMYQDAEINYKFQSSHTFFHSDNSEVICMIQSILCYKKENTFPYFCLVLKCNKNRINSWLTWVAAKSEGMFSHIVNVRPISNSSFYKSRRLKAGRHQLTFYAVINI